jgi:hypothetical protein
MIRMVWDIKRQPQKQGNRDQSDAPAARVIVGRSGGSVDGWYAKG